MVTRRIEPCITGEKIARNSLKLVSIGKSLNPNSRKFVSSGKSLNPNSQKFVSSGKSLNPNSRKFVPPKHGTFDSSQNFYCSFFATAQVISHILIFSSFIIWSMRVKSSFILRNLIDFTYMDKSSVRPSLLKVHKRSEMFIFLCF